MFRFVRFYTLEEAKNAVREKNLKVLGNRQINVELSSCTRRNLQANSEDDGMFINYYGALTVFNVNGTTFNDDLQRPLEGMYRLT